MEDNKKTLSVKDVERFSGVPARTIQRLAKAGLIGKKLNDGLTSSYVFTLKDLKSKHLLNAKLRVR